MESISIGSITVPAAWIAAAGGFIIAYVFLVLWKKKVEADVYGNAVFTFVLTWKLSVILFSFKLTMANPVGILYFNGGTGGVLLGTAAAALYYGGWGVRRISGPSRLHLVPAWFLTVGGFELVIRLMEGQATLLVLLFSGVNALFIYLAASERKPGGMLQYLTLFTGVQVLFQSLLGGLLSPLTAVYIGVAAVLAATLAKGSATK